MRYKNSRAFFKTSSTLVSRRSFTTITDPYAKAVSEARGHKGEMEALIRRWERHAHAEQLDIDKAPMHAINSQLETLITYHSLKLTDRFSLSLEETTDLIKESKTHQGKDFYEQLRVINHHRILNYYRQYQQELYNAGWCQLIRPKNTPDEKILGGIENLAQSFALIFGEGSGGGFDSMYGNYHPKGTFYFFDRPEQNFIINGQNLLIRTLKQPIEDPFMNAAIIHNEFAQGHNFDKEFGLLFCRLHMNFALMLTGHAPLVIDSSRKEEYQELTQPHNLPNPMPLAAFLAQCMNETYQKHILPILEDGVPSYIKLHSKQDYLEMLSEQKLAQDYFNEGNFHQAKIHIETARKCALELDGIIPFIMGTHIIHLSKLKEKIDEKLHVCQSASAESLKTEEKNDHDEKTKSGFIRLKEAEKRELQRSLEEAEDSRNKFSAY